MTTQDIINAAGPAGSENRLKCISSLNLGSRSEAANRVLQKRQRRRHLMIRGFTAEEACRIVRLEESNKLLLPIEKG